MMTTKRNGTIDLMRFLFCLLVMCYHTRTCFIGGYIAVDFFFILSGYLMAQSMRKTAPVCDDIGLDTIRFIIHKAARVFPFYIVAWLISLFISIVIKSYSVIELIKLIYKSPYNIIMMEMGGVIGLGHHLLSSWFISAMLIAMLFIYPIRRRNGSLFDCVFAPMLFLLFAGYCHQRGEGVGVLTIDYLSPFHFYTGLFRASAEISLGCLCFRAVNSIPLFPTKACQFLLTAVEWLGYIAAFILAYKYKSTEFDIVTVFWLSISISISFSEKSLTASIIRNRSILFLGDFSLCLYLVHQLVNIELMNFFRINAAVNPRFFMTYFGLSAVLAVIVFYCGRWLIRNSGRIKKLLAQ